jgi:hypothetical protein
MDNWKFPPRLKIYEALGAIADHRVEMSSAGAVVTSSSRHKHYEVVYNAERGAIGSNDNGSYWVGYLGYPAIAVLMLHGQLPFDASIAALVSDIQWKELNDRYEGRYDDVEQSVRERIESSDATSLPRLDRLIDAVEERLRESLPRRANTAAKPPEGW